MSYRISLTEEQHGYTIRLEKTKFNIEEKQTPEVSETVATLAIMGNRSGAMETFYALNHFIDVFVNIKILDKTQFRYLPSKF